MSDGGSGRGPDQKTITAAFELHPSPVRPLTLQEIDEHLNGGQWRRSVWFGGARWRDEARRRGFSEGDLVVAADALAAVYDPETCRRLLSKSPRHSRLVFGLFRHVPWWGRLIGLGLDLAECSGRLREATARRLADPEEFKGVDLELQVQSNASRSGLSATLPPGDGAEPRADFVISGIGIGMQLEVKGRNIFIGEETAAAVEGRFSTGALTYGYAPPPDRHWHIEGIGAFRKLPMTAEGRRQLDQCESDVFGAIAAVLDAAKQTGWPPGIHEINNAVRLYVSIAVGDAGGRWSVDFFDAVDPGYKAAHAGEIVRKHQYQLQGLGKALPGVFFLDLPWETVLAPVRESIERDIAGSPATFRFLDAVILRTSGRRRQQEPLWEWHEWFVDAWKTPWSRLQTFHLSDLTGRIANSPHRLMFGWLRPTAGQPFGPPPAQPPSSTGEAE